MSVSKDGVEGEQEGFIGSSSRCPTKYLFFQCSCLQCRSLKKRRKKYGIHLLTSLTIEFSLVTLPCLTLCDPMDCGIPHFPVHHQLPELAQTHVHRVSDAIQLSHSLSSPSPPAFNLSQHQGLFQGISSFHQVAKVLEFQLQHQSF